jgi:uracil phosphoribosyltransferase
MNKQQVTVVSHPLVQHKLTLMRMQTTQTSDFRRLLREVSMLLAYEVTRDLPLVLNEIQTPIQSMMAPLIEKKITLVSILRAGNGLLEGMLELLPWAKVGHIGLYRDPQTLTPVEYYFKMPPDMPQ